MQKDYLPSKQFIKKVIAIILFVGLVFGVHKSIGVLKNQPHRASRLKVNIVQSIQDSNNNGIPDWEERLWGLNPKKDGEENKAFIMERRKALNPNADFQEEEITETDTLAKEFFAVVMALQQTGDLDEDAMQAIGEAVSEKITAEPIPDKYTRDMLKVISDSPENVSLYYQGLQKIISKYQGEDIGNELTFIIQGIAYEDQQVLDIVKTIALAYRGFGEDLILLPVPDLLSSVHLSMANNYEKNSEVIEDLTKVLDDPTVGMRAILNYKKYNDALAADLNSLSYILN